MRGMESKQKVLFSYIDQEDRIPENHPLRKLREMVDEVLERLSGRFRKMYSDDGRPSIPPEHLLRAMLIQVLYTIRSERLLMEQLDYNLLFRWFVGWSMDDAVWDHSTFSKNRDRLLEGDIATEFLAKVLNIARGHGLMSDEHFTVDGTLIEAWAGQKSFQKRGKDSKGESDDPGNPTVDFHGQKRANDTHQSTTDPEARLHEVIDNRHGLVVSTRYSQATGRAERDAAGEVAEDVKRRRKSRVTIAADKGYDTGDFITRMRKLRVTPHVAQNTSNRSSAIDKRTTRHQSYALSQHKRKLVEQIFGWLKTIGLMRKTRHKGLDRGGWMFTFANAVYNLIRIRNLQAAAS